jgi:hypothetical protein
MLRGLNKWAARGDLEEIVHIALYHLRLIASFFAFYTHMAGLLTSQNGSALAKYEP